MSRHLLLGLALVPAGALTALPAVLLHQQPWGLVLALLAPVAGALAVPPGWPRVGYVAGWLAVLGVALTTRPGGDVLVPATASGYTLLLAGLALLLLALVTLPGPARRRPVSDARDDHGARPDPT